MQPQVFRARAVVVFRKRSGAGEVQVVGVSGVVARETHGGNR